MSWWQKKIIPFALRRLDLFDDEALDPKNFDASFGRTSTAELRNVGLKVERISKLLQLPPSLRVDAARVLSLRLSLGFDFYQAALHAEVDGVVVRVCLTQPDKDTNSTTSDPRSRPGSPEHRKTHRRLKSPPPSASDEGHLPTTEELARSFLLDEPPQERRDIEASISASKIGLDESVLSAGSDAGDVGIGAPVGLPAFLAGYLQRCIDGLRVHIKRVEVRLESHPASGGGVPVILRLSIGSAVLEDLGNNNTSADSRMKKRHFSISDISLDMLHDHDAGSQIPVREPHVSPNTRSAADPPLQERTFQSEHDVEQLQGEQKLDEVTTSEILPSSHTEVHGQVPQPIADSMIEPQTADDEDLAISGSDILLGDDNLSWGSRRGTNDAIEQDLWNSMASDDDLPESLLLERASTPRTQTPRNVSPHTTRSRRAVSPYERSLQSPGSWPRYESPPRKSRLQQSLESWPLMDQTHEEVFRSFISSRDDVAQRPMDNKLNALEMNKQSVKRTDLAVEENTLEIDEISPEADDMLLSRVYSHEEAESLYMSAMTQSPRRDVPGGWHTDDTTSERPDSPRTPQEQPVADVVAVGDRAAQESDLDSNPTPRPASPAGEDDSIPLKELDAEILLLIDQVSVWVPAQAGLQAEESPHEKQVPEPAKSTSAMPGAFSMYSEPAALQSPETLKHPQVESRPASNFHAQSSQLDVALNTVVTQIDMASCRTLYLLLGALQNAYQNPAEPDNSKSRNAQAPKSTATGDIMPFSVSVQSLRWSLMERLDGRHIAEDVPLFSVQTDNVWISYIAAMVDVRFGKAQAWLSGGEFLSFDRQNSLGSSTVLTDATPDFVLQHISRKTYDQKRPTTEVHFDTLPLRLILDLSALDDTLVSFGGLSGFLEISSSLLADSEASASPLKTKSPKGARGAKGVRFASDTAHEKAGTLFKLNGRLSSTHLTLRGEKASIDLHTSSVKAVYREQGAVATVQQLKLVGPVISSSSHGAPILVEVGDLRVEYLLAPHEKDLERLMSLLTPTKDRYDSDDDILVDTLMRQRQKGALLRVAVGSTRVKVESFDCLHDLHTLGGELTKLSTVAKYLPEDERPGILTLVRLKEFTTHLSVSDQFGELVLKAQDFHCASVPLPFLLAFSVGTMSASRGDEAPFVHALVPLSGGESTLPMVMLRMLGNEAEPTVKIKLFNVGLEYSVALIQAFNAEETPSEKVVTNLAQSMADFALRRENSEKSQAASHSSGLTSKRTNIDLLIHDSGLGLTPQNLPSKIQLIFTDAKFTTLAPPKTVMTASLILRKAAILVVDHREGDDTGNIPTGRSAPGSTTISARVFTALAKQGYVSVGSIMSAKVSVSIEDIKESDSKAVVVDASNELLLLESCADSTETLFATLGALAPPSPPSTQPKYLTEPEAMTIEDMMASFTGDAFVNPEMPPETLFDAEEEQDGPSNSLLEPPIFGDETGALLAESEMTGSLYGPISGTLEGEDDITDRDSPEENLTEVAESLLEDDPFEMTIAPTDVAMSDAALVRDLAKQSKPQISDRPVELDLCEVEDLGFDPLGAGQQALNSGHKFTAPTAKVGQLFADDGGAKLPLRVRLRDTHILWNIHDGYDWQRTRDRITEAVENVEARAEERMAVRRQSHDPEEDESVIGDFLFNSIYVGVPANGDAQELRRQINRGIDDLASETESLPLSGQSRPTAYSTSSRPLRALRRRRLKLERSRAHKVAFELKGVAADVLVFPPDSPDVVSAVDLRVKDVEIFDNVPTSTWRKFLTCLDDGPNSREMAKPMAHIQLDNVKTLQDYSATELAIHVSVLPLRLHVDQDALDFIVRFFEFKDESSTPKEVTGEQPFIQRLEVETVDLQLDYKPKRIDYGGLRSGHTTELMNIITLEAANIRLKHTIVYGIRGFEPIHKTLNDIWMPDIRRHQLPTILAGLAPVRSLVNIGVGVRDVIAIPIREYRKDGRVVRSIQKGALHFGKTTTSELARLGAKIAIGTQNILQGAEGLLAPQSASPSNRPNVGRRVSSEQGWQDLDAGDGDHEAHTISAYANQPVGVFAGLRSARRYLERDLLTARDAFIAVQGELLESNSPGAAVAALARHAPTVILRPVIGASRAVGTTLLGVGNQIDQENVTRAKHKYKSR